jgi:ElaB/YqjD/DUF883 family membrane-anchored ribosome-binding protein
MEVSVVEIGYDDRTRAPDSHGSPQHAAAGAVDAVGSAASDTAGAAKEQTRQVTGEVKQQVRNLAGDAKSRVGAEVQGQNERLADGIRRFASELEEMVRDRDDSPARGVVTQVSQGGHRVADYLSEHGPDGVLQEVQDFARRRPGTFLAVAAAAGLVVGRLGKGVLNANSSGSGSSSNGSASTGFAGTGSPNPGFAGTGSPSTGSSVPASTVTPETSAWAAPASSAVADVEPAVTQVQPAVPPAGTTLTSSSTTYTGTPVEPGVAPTVPQAVDTTLPYDPSLGQRP